MINAAQARDLYARATAAVDTYLTNTVEPAIKHAAAAGKRSCTIHVGSVEVYKQVLRAEHATEHLTCESLKTLGYTVEFGSYDSSCVPRECTHQTDSPRYYNLGITISW
jgi:dihydrofolate reductase